MSARVRVLDPEGEPRWGEVDAEWIVFDNARTVREADAVYSLPLDDRPSKIIAVHLNYPSRVEEYKARTPPEPSYFLKPPSSLNVHRGEIVRPAGTAYLNYEGEVALVIGETCRGATLENALSHVAGYSIANDVGLHDFRHADRGSMLRVKGQDGFCPIGPTFVPAGEVDPTNLTVRTYVDGEVVQEGSTSELLFPFAYMLADLSRLITLEPGDVLLTGTPANSRPMEPGSLVEVEVEGIGRLSNTIVERQVDWLGIRAMPEDSPNTRHVALAISEEEAEAGVGRRY